MSRIFDQIASVLVALIGIVHLVVGNQSFLAPTERGVWFLSAGFLLVVTGLANLARARARATGRFFLQAITALVGSLAILISGGLIAAATPTLLFAPQTLVLLTLGLLLTGFSLRDLFRRP